MKNDGAWAGVPPAQRHCVCGRKLTLNEPMLAIQTFPVVRVVAECCWPRSRFRFERTAAAGPIPGQLTIP